MKSMIAMILFINSNISYANDMQTHKLEDAIFAEFAMTTTYCNDHDWGDASYDLENLFNPHDEYVIDNKVCNSIESGFGRLSTLGKMNPTYLESVLSYDFFDKSGFGEVMTLINVNPTTLEDCKTFMHEDHENNALCDNYIVEFIHDGTQNYYEIGTYAFTYCNNTKFLLYVLEILKLYFFPFLC